MPLDGESGARAARAIDDALKWYTTPDVTAPGRQPLGTDEFTQEVLDRITDASD